MDEMPPRRASLLAALLAIASPIAAQFGGTGADGRLRPTTDVTLDTTSRPQGWDFVDISIPAGVTVHLVGTHPAILRSIGPVVVDGRIEADGQPATSQGTPTPGSGGPGGFAGGAPGHAGLGPAGGQGGIFSWTGGGTIAEHGGHATPAITVRGLGWTQGPVYGSALPFDLLGGSGGGGQSVPYPPNATSYAGGGGGGVIVLLTDGAVTIPPSGVLTANGGASSAGLGAGGAVMIRSASTVTVHGSVEAAGLLQLPPPPNPYAPPARSGDGFVRIDASTSSPLVTGSIVGVSVLFTLPHLRASDAQLGAPWDVTVTPRPGDDAAVFIAPAPGSVQTPFGLLGLDPNGLMLLGTGRATPGAIESTVALTPTIPNMPALRGATIHTQALAFDRTGFARLSNATATVIQ